MSMPMTLFMIIVMIWPQLSATQLLAIPERIYLKCLSRVVGIVHLLY